MTRTDLLPGLLGHHIDCLAGGKLVALLRHVQSPQEGFNQEQSKHAASLFEGHCSGWVEREQPFLLVQVTAALLVADIFRGISLITFPPSPTIQARADVPPGVSHLVTPDSCKGIPIPVPRNDDTQISDHFHPPVACRRPFPACVNCCRAHAGLLAVKDGCTS